MLYENKIVLNVLLLQSVPICVYIPFEDREEYAAQIINAARTGTFLTFPDRENIPHAGVRGDLITGFYFSDDEDAKRDEALARENLELNNKHLKRMDQGEEWRRGYE